jgi:hypothetical protein
MLDNTQAETDGASPDHSDFHLVRSSSWYLTTGTGQAGTMNGFHERKDRSSSLAVGVIGREAIGWPSTNVRLHPRPCDGREAPVHDARPNGANDAPAATTGRAGGPLAVFESAKWPLTQMVFRMA